MRWTSSGRLVVPTDWIERLIQRWKIRKKEGAAENVELDAKKRDAVRYNNGGARRSNAPNLRVKIIPTKIRWLKLSATFPMGLGTPPRQIKIMFESLKSWLVGVFVYMCYVCVLMFTGVLSFYCCLGLEELLGRFCFIYKYIYIYICIVMCHLCLLLLCHVYQLCYDYYHHHYY